jgi:hypothetical protein
VVAASEPPRWSYERYLDAKISVEDRALHRGVIDALREALVARATPSPLRVLDVGGGTGTMVRRAIAWSLFNRAEYTLLDADGDRLKKGLDALKEGWEASPLRVEEGADGALILRDGNDLEVHVAARRAEVFEFLDVAPRESFDLVIASSFLDLVDVPRFLPRLLGLLARGGVFWFPINFDGETIFEPSHPLDGPLLAAYHRSMDERVWNGGPAGHSRTGRKLFHAIPTAGGKLHVAGSSDWVVHARGGSYPGDEAYFVHCILATIEEALSVRGDVSLADLTAWLETRREQLREGVLVYVAHQLDFVGSVP